MLIILIFTDFRHSQDDRFSIIDRGWAAVLNAWADWLPRLGGSPHVAVAGADCRSGKLQTPDQPVGVFTPLSWNLIMPFIIIIEGDRNLWFEIPWFFFIAWCARVQSRPPRQTKQNIYGVWKAFMSRRSEVGDLGPVVNERMLWAPGVSFKSYEVSCRVFNHKKPWFMICRKSNQEWLNWWNRSFLLIRSKIQDVDVICFEVNLPHRVS